MDGFVFTNKIMLCSLQHMFCVSQLVSSSKTSFYSFIMLPSQLWLLLETAVLPGLTLAQHLRAAIALCFWLTSLPFRTACSCSLHGLSTGAAHAPCHLEDAANSMLEER